MLPKTPFNTWVMDINDFIQKNRCQEVTSHSIYVASTTDFHPQGLFSEEIFGQIGTTARLATFGFIKLNCKIFQPEIYRTIIRLKQMYGGIMEGTIMAKFDEEEMDFVRCAKEDPDADTGYSFFVKNFERVRLAETGSQKRSDKIKFLKQYRDLWYCDKYLVEPVGLRDIRGTDTRLEKEDINKLYIQLMSFAGGIPPNTTNPIYDGVKMNILKKCYEIFLYLENIVTGKKGFLRGSYARRKIAMGTRNVISSANLNLNTPTDPRGLQYDETFCPLFQTMKGFQVAVLYHVRSIAFETVFPAGANSIPLINPKTMEMEYVEVDTSEVERFRSDEGINTLIHRFKDIHIRHNPIMVTGVDKKKYYLFLMYDHNNEIAPFRSLKDFKDVYPGEVIEDSIRPMTWADLMYMATFKAVNGKHVFITRYPIGQGPDSTYPSRVKLISTMPNREVKIINPADPSVYLTMPHYPIPGESFNDSLSPFPGRLQSLAGDFDGDTVSMNSVMTDDANEQITEFLNSMRSLVTPNQKLYCGGNTDLCALSVFNLSRDVQGQL